VGIGNAKESTLTSLRDDERDESFIEDSKEYDDIDQGLDQDDGEVDKDIFVSKPTEDHEIWMILMNILKC
jgi:hypothetical protein